MKIYRTCRVCKAVYFNKAWHHSNHISVGQFKKSRLAWTTRCPACKMAEAHRYEGLITITNIPTMASKELLYLIKGYCQRAAEQDCQHRLIEIIKQDPHTWVVTTTDKQLANKLARKISQAFDHVEVKPRFSDDSNPLVRIMVEFLPLFYYKFNLQT